MNCTHSDYGHENETFSQALSLVLIRYKCNWFPLGGFINDWCVWLIGSGRCETLHG